MGQSSSTPLILDSTAQETPLEALENAERIDHYLERIQESPINRKAREGYQYAPMVDRFLDMPINDAQFPQGRILQMMPSADGGLPHTRGKDLICIPAYYPPSRLATLLTHERIHLHQKQHRDAYNRFYIKAWGFKPNIYTIPDDIAKRIRLNPDTVGWPHYIWRDTWIPLCLFERDDAPSLRDCSYCWYNPKGGVLLKTMPPAWHSFFGDVSQVEHPNELSACYGATFDVYQTVPAAKLYSSFLFNKEDF